MIRLWRRFKAWLTEPEVRVIAGQWPEPWPSAETCREGLETLIRIGASPRTVEIAQRVWAEAHAREVLSQPPFASVDLHMWEGHGSDYVREQHRKRTADAVAPHCASCAKEAAHRREEKAV